jgi:DNA-binding MarR family transcriptional regulator
MTGLRPLHAPLLAYLLGGARRAADLAAESGVSRQAMAQVIATLERDGYLERIEDPGDGRAKLVCLTAKGRAALRVMRASNQSLEGEWAARLGPERLAVLRQIVSDLLGH